MRHMTVRTKLIVGFGLCVVVICLLSGYTIYEMRGMGRLQHHSAERAKDAELATRASFIGEVTYSIVSDAIINRELDGTRKEWARLKESNLQLLNGVKSVVDNDAERALLKKAEEGYSQMVRHFEGELLPLLERGGDSKAIQAIDGEIDGLKHKIREELSSISTALSKEADDADRIFDSYSDRVILVNISLSVVGIMGAIVFGTFITLSVTRLLTRVISGLSESADQVASASGHIASSSQQLAEGASQQAAAVEETSASLEEMSSMTKQNADNARQADDLMKNVVNTVKRAGQSMADLTASMTSTGRASEETQKIIKSIDEIAFQTNLLALNAAVEAARAGEAGAGFAVVADEVRNLAMRAAEAARTTASLIEGTVKEIRQGNEIVARTSTNFDELSNSIGRVGELIGEISAASQEQAQGIEQINKAVTEMDKITQQNAANAEESASASEEMNAQAENLNIFVGELSAMMGSSTNGLHSRSTELPANTQRSLAETRIMAGTARVRENRSVIAIAPESRRRIAAPSISTEDDF